VNYFEIPALRLATAGLLIVLAALISRSRKLDLERELAIGALRAAVQLIAIGYALVFIFNLDSPVLVAPVLALMLEHRFHK
jgi:putative ABC transport system permease protein